MLYLQIIVTLILVMEIATAVRDYRTAKWLRNWIIYSKLRTTAEILAMWRKEEGRALPKGDDDADLRD